MVNPSPRPWRRSEKMGRVRLCIRYFEKRSSKGKRNTGKLNETINETISSIETNERTGMNEKEQMVDEIIEIVPERDDVRNDDDRHEEKARNQIEFIDRRRHRFGKRASRARAGHRNDRTGSIVGKCNGCVHHPFRFVCLSVCLSVELKM